MQTYIGQLDGGTNKVKQSSGVTVITSKKSYVKLNSTTTLRKNSINSSENEENNIAIYNFTIKDGDKEGFSLLIGDTRFPQVLAYSPKGSLNDTMYNEGLKEWANTIPDQIEDLYSSYYNTMTFDRDSLLYEVYGVDKPVGGSYPCVRDSVYLGNNFSYLYWGYVYYLSNAHFVVTNHQYSIDKILQTQWDQGTPYNNNLQYFPSSCNKPNQHIYTGCVTTAIAQLMAYYEWPQTYNWSLLKQTPRITPWSNTAQINEVARLMKNIFDMASPSIDCDGTGIARSNTRSVMSRYFNYGSNWEPSREGYMYPMMVLAQTSTGSSGHAYIIDGYCEIEYCYAGNLQYACNPDGSDRQDGNGQYIYFPYYKAYFVNFDYWVQTSFPAFHINWGWGGYSDGWYSNRGGVRYDSNVEYLSGISKK